MNRKEAYNPYLFYQKCKSFFCFCFFVVRSIGSSAFRKKGREYEADGSKEGVERNDSMVVQVYNGKLDLSSLSSLLAALSDSSFAEELSLFKRI